jgi:transcriptional regulator with XRE-family HTH domain
MSGIDEEATRERVCALLKERGLTDRVLSEKIGISRQAVNKWRHKMNFVDIENLYILSGILRMKIDDLLVPRKRSQERAVLIETNGNIGDLSNLRLKRLKRYYVLIMEMMARKMPRDASQAS